MSFSDCLRSPGLSEESVERIQERNVGSEVVSRVRAMDSSSAAARENVSRSLNLVSRVLIWSLRD